MSDENRPILFLDIDGVISLYGIPGEISAAREIMVEVPLSGAGSGAGRTPALTFDGEPARLPEVAIIPVSLAAGIEERLRRLADAFEVIWCSGGWLQTANHLLVACELDLGPFESLQFQDSKLEAILARAGERRWAFIDDEVSHEMRKRPDLVVPEGSLLIETDPGSGLTEEHVEKLLSFVGA